jgi:hypothetical protein
MEKCLGWQQNIPGYLISVEGYCELIGYIASLERVIEKKQRVKENSKIKNS